ncbi:MAG: hypothetical protein MAG431_02201 [Chloroflexi bacterium]|nr:hypothetical protein [Chloroflexota bacterium]
MGGMSTTKTLYVDNLIKACNYIQRKMNFLVSKDGSADLESLLENPQVVALRGDIDELVQSAEDIFERNEASAANLSVRSRRAYQWLKFLSESATLHQHLRAMCQLHNYIETISAPRLKKRFKPHINLFHFGSLYMMRAKGSVLEIKIHEAYIFASQEVFEALVNIAYEKGSPQDKALVKEFSAGETYAEVVHELEYLGIPQGANAQGKHYNLEDVFQRVNRLYFHNQMEQPHLTWNRQLTYRSFGHYHYATDTLMVSRSLDLPDTPVYVLDFVMYHELLHKKLGYNLVNGRRYGHTPAFKKEEGKFKKHQEARAYMKKLSRKLS